MTETDDRIAAVEHGLLPAISMSGKRRRMDLAARMAHYQVPAVGLAIIEPGGHVRESAYGFADSATRTPANPGTLFQAACLSKIVTSVLVLRLVDRGHLDLDRPVNDVLKTWRIPENEFTIATPVTLRHLLSHHAATTVDGYGNGFARRMQLPTLAQLLDGKSPAASSPVRVVGPVGRKYRYSSGGYAIAQLVVEDVTGRPFEDVAREVVLEPAGMASSTFECLLPPQLEARAANGHLVDGQPLGGGWNVTAERASSGLWTTAGDFARMLVGVSASLAGRPGGLLPPALAGELFRSQFGGLPTLGAFGFGDGDARRVIHTGSNMGFRAEAVLFADGQRGAVVLTNGENGDRVSKEILNSIADVYGWPGYVVERGTVDLPQSDLSRYIGQYEMMPGVGFVIEWSRAGTGLVVDALGFGRGALFASSETELFEPETPTEFSFQFGPDGRATSARVTFHGKTFPALRIR